MFAIVVALAIVGITVLVFATRPQPPETVASGGTTTAPPINNTPGTQRAGTTTSTSERTTTTTRSRSTTTETTEESSTTSSTRRTTTTTSRSSSGTYSPPGGEYTITFPARHQSVTDKLKGTVGNNSAISIVDAEATDGLETYIAMLGETSAPLSGSQLEQLAKTMRSSGNVSNIKSVTVAGHPAVRFQLEQDGFALEVVMVTSGTKLVMLMAGSASGNDVDFDGFVNSLKFP